MSRIVRFTTRRVAPAESSHIGGCMRPPSPRPSSEVGTDAVRGPLLRLLAAPQRGCRAQSWSGGILAQAPHAAGGGLLVQRDGRAPGPPRPDVRHRGTMLFPLEAGQGCRSGCLVLTGDPGAGNASAKHPPARHHGHHLWAQPRPPPAARCARRRSWDAGVCIRHRLWCLRLYVIRERSRAGRAGRNADGRNAGWSDWATLGQPRDAFGTEPPKDRDLSSSSAGAVCRCRSKTVK